MNSYYSGEELAALGLKSYGKDVLISRKASIYGAGEISLGSHVRIDDFCILSGNISIGNYVHLAAGSMLFAGADGISIGDYCGISSRCCVYSKTDDFSGRFLANPTVPAKYANVTGQHVEIGRFAQIGSGSTLLPGAMLAEGAALGAMSLLSRETEPWGVYYGNPARRVGQRSREMEQLARQLEEEEK